jgi:hypothetical protein
MRNDTIDTGETFVQETIRELTVTELEHVAGGFDIDISHSFNHSFNNNFNGLANTGVINNSFNAPPAPMDA